MSDALLGRIATALEAIASKAGAEVKVVAADVIAEVTKVTKPRGRPVKGEENGAAVIPSGATAGVASAVVAATPEADPFELEPAKAAEPLTIEKVRAALIAYQKATSPETARKKLKEYGGVDSLASLTADKFQAVVDSLK